jgi:hypothetical protein
MSAEAFHQPAWKRVIAFPTTSLGAWSLKLLAASMVCLLATFVAIALHGGGDATRRASMAAGGKFFSLLSVALPFAGTFLCGIAAFFTGLAAGVKRERSITMLLPICVGGATLLWTLGEIFE